MPCHLQIDYLYSYNFIDKVWEYKDDLFEEGLKIYVFLFSDIENFIQFSRSWKNSASQKKRITLKLARANLGRLAGD